MLSLSSRGSLEGCGEPGDPGESAESGDRASLVRLTGPLSLACVSGLIPWSLATRATMEQTHQPHQIHQTRSTRWDSTDAKDHEKALPKLQFM